MSKRAKEDILLCFFGVFLGSFLFGVCATSIFFGHREGVYICGLGVSALLVPASAFGIGVVISSPDSQ